jgi:cell division protein FtsB
MALFQPGRGRLAVYITLGIAVAIGGGIAWAFTQQIAAARQMRAEEARLEQVAAAKQAYYEALEAELEYVKSDDCVEQWAREEAKMAKPGEVVVIVVKDSPDYSALEPTPTPTPEPEPRPFWRELWELAFSPPGR